MGLELSVTVPLLGDQNGALLVEIALWSDVDNSELPPCE